eukprot:162243_1
MSGRTVQNTGVPLNTFAPKSAGLTALSAYPDSPVPNTSGQPDYSISGPKLSISALPAYTSVDKCSGRVNYSSGLSARSKAVRPPDGLKVPALPSYHQRCKTAPNTRFSMNESGTTSGLAILPGYTPGRASKLSGQPAVSCGSTSGPSALHVYLPDLTSGRPVCISGPTTDITTLPVYTPGRASKLSDRPACTSGRTSDITALPAYTPVRTSNASGHTSDITTLLAYTPVCTSNTSSNASGHTSDITTLLAYTPVCTSNTSGISALSAYPPGRVSNHSDSSTYTPGHRAGISTLPVCQSSLPSNSSGRSAYSSGPTSSLSAVPVDPPTDTPNRSVRRVHASAPSFNLSDAPVCTSGLSDASEFLRSVRSKVVRKPKELRAPRIPSFRHLYKKLCPIMPRPTAPLLALNIARPVRLGNPGSLQPIAPRIAPLQDRTVAVKSEHSTKPPASLSSCLMRQRNSPLQAGTLILPRRPISSNPGQTCSTRERKPYNEVVVATCVSVKFSGGA